MTRYGVIDLGSNSIRLVVYEAPGASNKLFAPILDRKKMVGLSGYVEEGVLTSDGIKRAADALTKHLARARLVNCDNVAIFATAVLRNCKNSKQAIKQIEKLCGHSIRLLSGEEEAHLAFVGATFDRHVAAGTMIDIGGGSTELVAIHAGNDTLRTSIEQGSVSSYAQFVSLVLPTPDEYEAVRLAMRERLAAQKAAIDYTARTLYGVGGSVRAVAKLKSITGGKMKVAKRLSREDLKALESLLYDNPSDFAHMAVRVVPDRMHTIGTGMALVSVLMDELDAHRIEVCRYGVREGFLLEEML